MQSPARLIRLSRIRPDQGNAWMNHLPQVPAGDSEAAPYGSGLRLFEDGIEIGPGHATHDAIRSKGGGRFSHWGNVVWFSASDNSSPLENGRAYDVLVPAGMTSGAENPRVVTLSDEELAELPPLVRFDLARTAFREIWPGAAMPDIGRRLDTDPGFAATFAEICPEGDYSLERKYNLDQLFQLARAVPGDVAECGTYKGASAYYLARRIIAGGLGKRLCLFDSFAGLPAPGERDGEWWRQGDLTGAAEDLRATLARLGDTPFVDVFPGWIPSRFAEVAERRFCFVHIDVDLYQPTRDSMEFFYPRLSPGGVIVLDDYGFQSCPGAAAAVDEFMADKPEPIINLSSGGAFIVRT